MKQIDLKENDLIIVDGYVTLDNSRKLGLGGYLYNSLDKKYPVIGIAKNNFATEDKERREIFRGESKTPLFVTSIGVDVELIASNVKKMSGSFRIPTLLKKLDLLTRQKI